MNKLRAIFSIPELRQKILITLLFLAIYRIGYYIPLPFINQERLAEWASQTSGGAFGRALNLVSMFSGGTLSQAVIFSFGVMPYISASIIFQLLASVYPPLEKLQKEGESGRKKINEYTRYATVPICIIQSYVLVQFLMSSQQGNPLYVIRDGYSYNHWHHWVMAITTLTAGTLFLMWLGEQIDEYGIGNGISLIIMAGIVSRIPQATSLLLFDPTRTTTFLGLKLPALKESILTLGGGSGSDVSFEKLLVLVFLFVAVVVAVIFITKGQRRIPTQSAKHVRGRRVYGGTRQYLPLRVNQAGVMPVIFAGSLLAIPALLFGALGSLFNSSTMYTLQGAFSRGSGWIYNVSYIAMIFFFCFFWTAIVFNPKDMANNLKDFGSFIPGYRPGKRTSEYLERVMVRITYVGAAFLAVIAIIPSIITTTLGVNPVVASFYGGTGLLIVISVALDLVQKINSHLVMRNYPGLTDD
jgi:preprotein translocase subunit SecY